MIITYNEISTNNPLIDKIEVLYTESFPENERREFIIVKNYLDDINVPFKIIAATSGDMFVGFLSFWIMENFCYGEHFAINPELRGGGIGQNMLEYLKNTTTKPIVLEVETPEDEMSIRRINFYKRCGFKLWEDVKYIQPAYDSTKESIELKLMTFGDINITEECDVIKSIHRNVYNVGK